MKSIPIYALYGEAEQNQGQDWLHWETVNSRSRLYDFRIEPHRHEQFFQLLHLRGGSAKVTIDGHVVVVAPPALIAIPALTVHGYEFTPDVDGLVITLFERDVRSALAGAAEMAAAFVRPQLLQGRVDDPNMAVVHRAVEQLITESESHAPGHDAAMPAALTLLLVSIFRAHIASDQLGEAGDDRSVHHAQAFRTLVDQRYRQTRAINDYADVLGISATHLNRIARQILGASALKVIERRIALEAKRYLLFSNLGIKEIADLLGYSDPAYFTRFCTRALGVAPGQYRQLARAKMKKLGQSGGKE